MPRDSDAEPKGSIRERILGAAFHSIAENGFAGASTLDIASRAQVSKRELYTLFDTKDDILLACIAERASAISDSLKLPEAGSREVLKEVLRAFGYRLLKGTTRPNVITAFRFAVARSQDLPEAARIIDKNGRRASRAALARLLEHAIAQGLLRPVEVDKMVRTYFGLVWADLQVGLLLGVAKAPTDAEMQGLAGEAASAFLALYAAAPD
jgi:AcrR family transcriptional regulator